MLSSNSGMDTTMLVSPANAATNGSGFMNGDNGWWIILFIILLFAGNGFGNNNGMGGGNSFNHIKS